MAVLAVVLGAVLAAAYLDLSNFDSLRRALSYDKADAAGENTYDYDNDRTNRFALLGDRLLVVSTTRVSVLADDGSEVYAQEVKLDSPAIALGGRTAAVYDVGGTTLYILGERGLVRDLSTETENGIISAKLNSSDMLALVTDKSGYKSSVSVYNASGERVFTFNSSNRYMIDACVERGGKHVAVATLGSEDAMFVSTIRRYALDQETAVSACVLDDSLLYELSQLRRTLVAVTDDRFLALSGDGSLGRILRLRLSLSARQHARRDGFRRARALALPLRQRGQARHRRRGGQPYRLARHAARRAGHFGGGQVPRRALQRRAGHLHL